MASPLIALYTDENMEEAALVAANSIRRNGGLWDVDYRLRVYVTKEVNCVPFINLGIETVTIEPRIRQAEAFKEDFRQDSFQGASAIMLEIWDMLFKAGEDRVIFIDADTFVLGDISDLINVNLGEYSFGACPDGHWDNYTHQEHDIDYKYKLHPRNRGIYFNAGVVVLDLQRFFKGFGFDNKFSIVDAFMQGSKNYMFREQCFLNEVIYEFYVLPKKYNWAPDWEVRNRIDPGKYQQMHLTADVRLIHFIGEMKPWNSILNSSNPITYQLRMREYFEMAVEPIKEHLSDEFFKRIEDNYRIATA